VREKDSPGLFQVKSKEKVIELLTCSPEQREVWIKVGHFIHVQLHHSRCYLISGMQYNLCNDKWISNVYSFKQFRIIQGILKR